MNGYKIGSPTTRYMGEDKVKYRCSKGHEFEDWVPGGNAPEGVVMVLGKPKCARCLAELLGDVIIIQ